MKTARRNAAHTAAAGGRPSPSEISPEQVQALIREARRRRSEYIGRGLVRLFRALASVFRLGRRNISGPHGQERPASTGFIG